MILTLNFSNNLHKTRCTGVFGVADCKFDVRIANFKIADTRWRLLYSNFEVFKPLTQNLLYEYFLGRWLRFWSQNWKIQNLVTELQNSKWRIQNGGYISANSQFFRNRAESWYMGVFGVADYESGVRILQFWHQLALLCLEVAANEWIVQPRVLTYIPLPSWILQFWHQICNQRPQKPPCTQFHSNCKKLRICTNITAILNFSILTLYSQSVARKFFFFYDLIIDHKYGTLHALMPKIRQNHNFLWIQKMKQKNLPVENSAKNICYSFFNNFFPRNFPL